MNPRLLLTPTAWLVGALLPSQAALSVNQVLGIFEGGDSTGIVGDTATGANNADIYTSAGTNPAANWGNELVYEFSLSDQVVANLTGNALVGDPDFFLLTGLETVPTGTKNDAAQGLRSVFLDGPPGQTESFGILAPGTYYLSVDSFSGLDGALSPIDSTFDLTLSFVGITPPSSFVDLGILGSEGTSFAIDSFGSTFDTELGVYTAAGTLLATNDDAGGDVESELVFPGGLPAGDYYVALTGFNSAFGDGFTVTGGSAAGDFVLNHPNGQESGMLDGGAVGWFGFAVVPEPSSLGLLTLLGLGLFRRCRG